MQKLSKFIYVALSAICLTSCNENEATESIKINNSSSCYQEVLKFEPDYKLNRFENEVLYLEKIDSEKDNISLQKPIVFIGSSTITNWNKTLAADFPNLPVIGHGIGGSTFPEQIYYKDRLVTKFNPKTVVIYCENDIFGIRQKSEEQVLSDACYLINEIKIFNPASKIFILSLKHSPSRRSSIPKFTKINSLLKSYCIGKSYVSYIDINSAMYLSDGKTLDGSIFQSDSLHMNRKGYERWISIIKPILEADYKSR